ncbi:MAG: YceK/YidQ family lipoprotein [Pseudomonadaceae bacterium]|jgi:uncharacterized protein YceK|nr:YceK/YidQ family lipoprotein [Pseudomonadaceae bacterium]
MNKPLARFLVGVALAALLQGCASVSTLNGAKTDLPIIYSGTRLDWYALHGGCCPVPRFGSEAPSYPGIDLPFSLLLDTLVLPFTVAAELGVSVGVRGGL